MVPGLDILSERENNRDHIADVISIISPQSNFRKLQSFFENLSVVFWIVLSVMFFCAPLFFKVINNPVFESEVKFLITIEPSTCVSFLDYCPIRSNTERRAIANRSADETTRESRLERSLVITSYYNYSLEMNQSAFVLASDILTNAEMTIHSRRKFHYASWLFYWD